MTLRKIAHRGGAALWPENTLFAFRNALTSGCDGVELDVQLTRDGEVVVFHDFRIKADICRDVRGKWLTAPGAFIKDLTLNEARVFDVGRPRPGSSYERTHPDLTPKDGEHIPTLCEVIGLVATRHDFILLIEIKTNYRDRWQSAPFDKTAEAVVAVLREADLIGRSILVGFDWAALIYARKIEPLVRCWFTTPRLAERHDALWAAGFDPRKYGGSIPRAIREAGGQGWLANRRDAAPANVREARGLGLAFAVWTVNDLEEMRRLAAEGVDAICTDRPELLKAV
ncbi:MAG: glycerophosphodiester phosphodiesterase family protein [Alphaproteobacteria bacterium]